MNRGSLTVSPFRVVLWVKGDGARQMPALRWAVSTGGFKPPSGIRESEWQENKSDEKDERLQQMELDNGWSLSWRVIQHQTYLLRITESYSLKTKSIFYHLKLY